MKFYQDLFEILHVESPVLYFFQFILRIPLNFSLDSGYKQCEFSDTLLEKSFEFIQSKANSTITFNLNFLLLLAEVDLIIKKRGCRENAF